MGTSVVRFKQNGQANNPSWGVLKDQKIYPLGIDATHHRDLMDQYFNNRSAFDQATSIDPSGCSLVTDLLSPLDDNIQLFAQGLNYQSHRDEAGVGKGVEDEENLIFLKGASTICAP